MAVSETAAPTPADAPAWMDDELEIFRASVRRFVASDFARQDERWREQGYVDPDAWRRAGALGLLCPDIPEADGGAGGRFAHDAVVCEELAYAGIASFGNAVQSITAHYLLRYGTAAQRQRWLPGMARGEIIAAIAMSEPGAGSDLQSIQTRARRDGDHYVLNGAKTFISNGRNANLICVVTRTDTAPGARGISLLMVEPDRVEGFRRGRLLQKVGQKGQDTAELFFEDCRVPAENLLGGEEGQGFAQLMQQLPRERLLVAIIGIATMERALDLTVDYVSERRAFGRRIADFQNTRFTLADCRAAVRVGRVYVDHCIAALSDGRLDAEAASIAKLWVTEAQLKLVDRCVQLHGGYGYMLESPIARCFTDSRAQTIYAGANEIMRELIARRLLGGKADGS